MDFLFLVDMEKPINVLKGDLLFSDISVLGDAYFSRSVLLLTEHNEDESIGFIINKPTKLSLNDFIPDLNCFFTVYDGGPVGLDSIFFVHILPNLISDSIEIREGIYWGGNFEELIYLLENNLIEKHQIRFFNGYSGWGKDQLINEINQKSWIISKNYFNIDIFKTSNELIWKNHIKDLGLDYKLFFNAPDNPNFN
jgi:putative transcriptional regulator